MFKNSLSIIAIVFTLTANGQYAPPVGEDGTTAIHKDSSAIIAWASSVESFERGPLDAAFPDGGLASYGEAVAALNAAEGTSTEVVSLGDGGAITLSFDYAIEDLPGPDFAVFENSFSDDYLEFAHVEVSTDGVKFVRIPSNSNIPIGEQTETYASSDATLVHNLAGKYRQGYGTPFDLQDVADSSGIDLMDINYIRIIDVVGTIDPGFGTTDSEGNIINDPYPTDFESGGFDLDAIGVIHSTDPTVRIIENQKIFRVYPNPSNGIINYTLEKSNCHFELVDVTGKMTSLECSILGELDLSDFNPGIYVLIAKMTNGEVCRSRIVLE